MMRSSKRACMHDCRLLSTIDDMAQLIALLLASSTLQTSYALQLAGRCGSRLRVLYKSDVCSASPTQSC